MSNFARRILNDLALCLSPGLLGLVLGMSLVVAAAADEPSYREDAATLRTLGSELATLAREGRCLKPSDIPARLARTRCRVSLPAGGSQPLSPENVAERARNATLIIGSVEPTRQSPQRFSVASTASAWVLTEDGVIVTNYHVFDNVPGEHFGVMTHDGRVLPVVDILAGDKTADVAVARVEGKGMTPLPLGASPPVGAWVAVMSHPDDEFFTFTQGYVSRYVQSRSESTKGTERWMNITADFAFGSSGAPVLDRFGSAVGIATMTNTIVYSEGRGRGQSSVQMVTKSAVPVGEIRKLIDNSGTPHLPPPPR